MEAIKAIIKEQIHNLAIETEVRVLAGCTHCGRRLVEIPPQGLGSFDEPLHVINGGTIIYKPYTKAEPTAGLPYCGECVNILFPEAI